MNTLLRKILAYIRHKPLDIGLGLLFAVAIVALVMQHLETQTDDDWAQFVSTHHCVATKFKDNAGPQTAWVCDDGKRYYRWRQQL